MTPPLQELLFMWRVYMIDKPLSLVARRPIDGSYVIGNTSSSQTGGGGRQKRSYKLNTELDLKPVLLVRHDDIPGSFEKQWRHRCARCRLPIGYESRPAPNKGDCTYIFPGSLTETQSSVPPSALDLNPVQTLKEQVHSPSILSPYLFS
ncbi:uncharacterized protein VP01_1016g4 [Puccinia sorghi]|uniref:STEEP1 domain-containing protein n=1 Tax=Puccinia sorghi TaxID=27349 RepID=A0A0L6VUW3_9BASI|nr:uncharacterized protein VP01_1016g4 [Puccinia sorghi]